MGSWPQPIAQKPNLRWNGVDLDCFALLTPGFGKRDKHEFQSVAHLSALIGSQKVPYWTCRDFLLWIVLRQLSKNGSDFSGKTASSKANYRPSTTSETTV